MTAKEILVPATLGVRQLQAFADGLAAASAGPPRDSPLVLRGHGPVFCEGLALDDWGDHDDGEDLVQPMTQFIDLILEIRYGSRTTIAVIEGRTAGGGLGIAAACDVIWATPKASFCLPEVHLGLAPNVIFPLLRQRVGAAQIRAMALDGLSRGAQRMLGCGLLDELVESSDLERRLAAWRRAMARSEPEAVAAVRAAGREDRLAMREAMIEGARRTAGMLSNPAVRRRIAAFEEWGAPWSQ